MLQYTSKRRTEGVHVKNEWSLLNKGGSYRILQPTGLLNKRKRTFFIPVFFWFHWPRWPWSRTTFICYIQNSTEIANLSARGSSESCHPIPTKDTKMELQSTLLCWVKWNLRAMCFFSFVETLLSFLMTTRTKIIAWIISPEDFSIFAYM